MAGQVAKIKKVSGTALRFYSLEKNSSRARIHALAVFNSLA